MTRHYDFYSDDWQVLPADTNLDELDVSLLSPADMAQPLAADRIMDILREPETLLPLKSDNGLLTYCNGQPVVNLGAHIALLSGFVRNRLIEGSFRFKPNDITIPGTHYALIADLKAKGDNINLDPLDPWYRRHQFRARNFFQNAGGLLLDIGCGDPEHSRKVFPSGVDYVGLDPFPNSSETFSICGFAEALPFKDECFDTVVFNTSLDHVLDDHGALEEAWRILKPGGEIYLVTLIWHKRASLLGDAAHFHHFREWEIKGLFNQFNIHRFMKVDWKGNDNRFGIYLAGKKSA